MSQLHVDNIRNRTGGPIGIPTGAVVTGVVTATTGNITGNQTVGGNLTVTGNAEVGGVLTYEDVTNVDSVGVVTARSGIEFGASGVGGTITATGQAEFVGFVTASNINVSGAITATTFVGDGTGLTGVASTDNIITGTASTFTSTVEITTLRATDHEGNFILDSYLFN